MALRRSVFLLMLALVATSALAQERHAVDLGLDDCTCEGEDCNYAPHCPQAATQAHQQPPPLQAQPAAAPAAPVEAPQPRGFFGRVRNGMGNFMSRWYDSDNEEAREAMMNGAGEVQLGPRVYMSDEDLIVCKTYEPSTGVSNYSPTQSTIRIPDELDLTSVTVEMNVSHSRIGALKVELEAKSGKMKPRKALLKPKGWGGSGENLLSTVFDDEAESLFPAKAAQAPFSGAYKPKGKLRRFVKGKGVKAGKGGTFGAWTLSVADVGRNPDTRTAVINSWKLNVCGVANLYRDPAPLLSEDILSMATAVQMPTEVACPHDATRTANGQCPLSAIDVMASLIEGSYNTTFGNPHYDSSEHDADAIAQGYLPPIEGLPQGPWRQAYDDYVERFNTWADTLPKFSNYLESLPSRTWELMVGYVYAGWLFSTLECIERGNCGEVVNNIPSTIIIG